jgi:transposase
MGEAVLRACRSRTIEPDADDRFDAHQGTPLGLGWKRGEQKQAIGRSRGGRNTKIHAIADAKDRLLSILLSGGEAHDCPPAPRLIRRTKAARKLLGDKAYDSAELRQWLKGRGTKAVIPNKSNRKQPFSSTRNPTSNDTVSRTPSVGSRTSAVSQLVTTDWRETFSPQSASSLLSYSGFYESRP